MSELAGKLTVKVQLKVTVKGPVRVAAKVKAKVAVRVMGKLTVRLALIVVGLRLRLEMMTAVVS
jgi:hypothetical protein